VKTSLVHERATSGGEADANTWRLKEEDLNELNNKDSTQEEEEAAAVFISNLEVLAKIMKLQWALMHKAVERDPVMERHQI
jgi:hypothetical protein